MDEQRISIRRTVSDRDACSACRSNERETGGSLFEVRLARGENARVLVLCRRHLEALGGQIGRALALDNGVRALKP